MSLFILNKSFAAISKKRCQKKSRESSSHNLKVVQLLSNPSFGAENHSTKLWLAIRFKIMTSCSWTFLPRIIVYNRYVWAFIPYTTIYIAYIRVYVQNQMHVYTRC